MDRPFAKPRAVIDAPLYYSPNCADLRLNGGFSTGFMGRTAYYRWEITGSAHDFSAYNSLSADHKEIVVPKGAMLAAGSTTV
jgi:hypothetical protein